MSERNHFTRPRLDAPMAQYAFNAPYARPAQFGDGQTILDPLHEARFQMWQQEQNAPYNPSPQADYDMKGFYRAFANPQSPEHQYATQGNSAYDNAPHYTDHWKTPYHDTFSAESRQAQPVAPRWFGDALFAPGGQMLKDESPPERLMQNYQYGQERPFFQNRQQQREQSNIGNTGEEMIPVDGSVDPVQADLIKQMQHRSWLESVAAKADAMTLYPLQKMMGEKPNF